MQHHTSAYEWFLSGMSVIALLLQAYVFYLIMRRSPRAMDEYKYFLYMTTVWDLVYTLFYGIIIEPFTFSPADAIGIRGVARYLGHEGARILACFAFYAGTNLVLSQDYSLVYRYAIIHGSPGFRRGLMSTSGKWIYLALSQVLGVYMGVTFYFIFVPTQDLPFWISRYLTLSPTPYALDPTWPDEVILWLDTKALATYIFGAVLIVIFLSSEILCVVLVRLILERLRQNSDKYTQKTYRLHVQFTILVAAQLLTPLILIITPLCFVTYGAFTKQHFGLLIARLLYALLAIYGVTNALFTILFVGPFRRHALSVFGNALVRLLRSLGLQRFGFVERCESFFSESSSDALFVRKQQASVVRHTI